MDQGIAAFLAISVVVIATPGQDTALTIRNTLLGGRPAGIATAVGVAGGQLTWTVAACIGITALLVASGPVSRPSGSQEPSISSTSARASSGPRCAEPAMTGSSAAAQDRARPASSAGARRCGRDS